MPKIVFDNWNKGLTANKRNKESGFYVMGRNIDPNRDLGFVRPGFLASNVVANAEIDQLIIDILPDTSSQNCYFLGTTDKLFQMTNLATEAWATNFDGANHSYYDIPNATEGQSLLMYNISGTQYLFYAYNKDIGGDVGTYNLSNTFNADFFSTDVGTGAAALQKAPHPMIEYSTYLYIGNGQYVGRYDGANDTLDATKLNLGKNWEVTKLIPMNNYIAVCAWKKHAQGSTYRTESAIFFWDGISSKHTYMIPVPDNKIENAINYNGELLIFTIECNLGTYVSLKRITTSGVEKISDFKFPIIESGTETDIYYYTPRMNAIDLYKNRIIWGNGGTSADSYAHIFGYGSEFAGEPYSLTQFTEAIATEGYYTGALKVVSTSKIFVSGYNGTTYILKKLTSGNATADLKQCYVDFGGKVRLNYIKYYFKPLVSGDSITPTLDLDYGTSFALQDPRAYTTISYTNDGAITSKRFNIQKNCHAVAPQLLWTAGGASISKVILDYDFIEDK